MATLYHFQRQFAYFCVSASNRINISSRESHQNFLDVFSVFKFHVAITRVVRRGRWNQRRWDSTLFSRRRTNDEEYGSQDGSCSRYFPRGRQGKYIPSCHSTAVPERLISKWRHLSAEANSRIHTWPCVSVCTGN